MHPFFISWRAHAVVAFALLAYTNDVKKLLLYLALVIIARISMLFVMLIWNVCRLQLVAAKALITNMYYLSFVYAPGSGDGNANSAASVATSTLVASEHTFLGHIVIFEGNIGAGKSTAVKLLEQCPASRVHLEQVPQDLLVEFQRGNGDPLQLAMGEARRVAIEKSVAALRAAPLTREIHDRSVIGCRSFAFANFVLGTLGRATLDQYLRVAGNLFLLLQRAAAPITIFYVDTAATICKARLERRDGPDRENSLQYLLNVSLLHALVLRSVVRLHLPNVKVHLFDTTSILRHDASRGGCVCQALNKHKEVVQSLRVPAATSATQSECGIKLSTDELDRLNIIRTQIGLPANSALQLYEHTWNQELYDALAFSG